MPNNGDLYADFSFSKPSPASVAKAGYKGVIGYLSSPATSGKNLTAPEAAGYAAVGLDWMLVWETTAQRALTGNPGGLSDGGNAFAQAQAERYALTKPLWFNVGDFAATLSQLAAISLYLRGVVQNAPGQLIGGYGTGYRSEERRVGEEG